jgi:hypothetical protein
MKIPLYDATFKLFEQVLCCASTFDRTPEEMVNYAIRIGEVFQEKVEENLRKWSDWSKEQYLLAERNRLLVRAAQTHCVYCEQPLDGTSHMDHIRPIKCGGTGEITNLVYACAKCNLSKNGQHFWKYLETKTKTVQSQIIRRLQKLGKQIPIDELEPANQL